MLLDAVLANPELNWLVSQAEKVAYFTTLPCPVPIETLPRATMKVGALPVGDPFPDRLPIGIDANGRALFLYLVLPTAHDDFRAFLGRHSELLRTVPAWTLRLLFPRSLAQAYGGFQAVVREELESPLQPRTVEELMWYFGQLRAMPNARTRPPGERFERAAEAFERPRFYRLYRHWLKDGDRGLEGVSSPVLSDALASGAGRLECFVLPHRYDHLAPLVDPGGSTARGAENAAERASTRVHSRTGNRLTAPNSTSPQRVAIDGAPEVEPVLLRRWQRL